MTTSSNDNFPFSPSTVQHATSFARGVPSAGRVNSATTTITTDVEKTDSPTTPSTPRNMASPVATVDAKKPLDISSLMSPPELPPYETFAQSALSSTSGIMPPPSTERQFAPNPPLSPPISPSTKSSDCIDPIPTLREGAQQDDPILYPGTDVSPAPSLQQPLFKGPVKDVSPGQSRQSQQSQQLFKATDGNAVDPKRVVDNHIAALHPSVFRKATPPEREHYELALYLQSSVMRSFSANPRGWLRNERAILKADREASMRAKSRFQPILPAAKAAAPGRLPTSRVSKPKPILPTFKPAAPSRQVRPNPNPATPLPKLAAVEIAVRQAPARRESAGEPGCSPTPEPRSRPVGPNREDKDFESLPDFSPPIESLPDKPNSLKVDWKGNPLDLRQDPFKNRLHPDELTLASCLRLDCATYLTSKRRIFIRRLDCARVQKEFRKTDAQQACRIDVNKASKLWTAYDRVGWLKLHWMVPHLEKPVPQ